MTDTEAQDALHRLPRVVLLCYCERVLVAATAKAPWLGSLLDPKQEAREFIDRDLCNNPPAFRALVLAEAMRFLHLRGTRSLREACAEFLSPEPVKEQP